MKLSAESYAREIAKGKQVYAKYTEVIGICKSAAEAQGKLEAIKLEFVVCQEALKGARTAAEIQAQITQLNQQLATVNQSLANATDEISMQEIGIYRRVYDFDHPEQSKLQSIDVESQKAMVKTNCLPMSATGWSKGARSKAGKWRMNRSG